MASPDTAAALLTAESIVIGALAILLQRRDILVEGRGFIYRLYLRLFGIVAGILISFSFLGSILYLHIAEYPAGMVGSRAEPEVLFNTTIIAFIGFFFLSMFILVSLHSSLIDDMIEFIRMVARKNNS